MYFFGVMSKGCYCFKSPHPVLLSLIRVRRVRFINETEANIFFEALMTISQNEVMPTFLFNHFISQEFPIAFFRVIPS